MYFSGWICINKHTNVQRLKSGLIRGMNTWGDKEPTVLDTSDQQQCQLQGQQYTVMYQVTDVLLQELDFGTLS